MSEPNSDRDPDGDAGSGRDPEPDPDRDADLDSGSGSDPNPDVGFESEPNSDADTARGDTDDGDETDHDEGVSTLAKQGSITFVGNVVNGALGFAIVMLMTRFVSPSVYGLWVLSTSVILFMQVFANLGLPLAIDYFVPQYLDADEHGKAKGVIVQVTATVLVTSSLVAFALAVSAGYVGAFFGEPAMEVALLFLSVAIPMLAIYNVLLTSYYSIKKLQYRVIMRDLVRPIVRFTVTAGFLLVGYGLLGILVGYVVGLFVAIAIGAAVFVYRTWDLMTTEIELVAPGPLVRYSLPLAMTSVVFVLMGHVDYFVLGFFLESGDVGIYRVGYMLGSGLTIIFNSLSPVFKPLIAETRDDIDLVEQRFRTMARWIVAITLPIAIFLSLGASSYLAVLYTPQYAEANAVVAVLAGAFMFNVAFGGPDGSLLQGLGYSRFVFANTLALFGANLVVSFALVPLIGIEGAAVGSATALVLVGALTLVEIYYLDGIHPFTRDFAKVVGAGVPAALAGAPVVVLLESNYLIAGVLPVVVVGVYLGTLIATDAFTEADAQMAAEFSPTLRKWLPVGS